MSATDSNTPIIEQVVAMIRDRVTEKFEYGMTLKDWREYQAPALDVAQALADAGLLAGSLPDDVQAVLDAVVAERAAEISEDDAYQAWSMKRARKTLARMNEMCDARVAAERVRRDAVDRYLARRAA